MTQRGRPWIIGHRGAPGYHPEHTHASYVAAIRLGADAVEPDVVLSSDGVPMVLHETELSVTTDVASRAEFAARRCTKIVEGRAREGWFAEDFSCAQLRTLQHRERWPLLRPGSAAAQAGPVLTLEELVQLVAGTNGGRGCALVIELKHSGYLNALGMDLEAAVVDALARHAYPHDQVLVESFEPAALTRMRAAGFTGPQALLCEGVSLERVLLQGRDAFGPAGRGDDAPAYLSVDKDLLLAHPGGAAAAAGAIRGDGWRPVVWTLRPENAFLAPRFRRGDEPAAHGDYVGEWSELIDAGVEAVFVDHPDLFAQVLAMNPQREEVAP